MITAQLHTDAKSSSSKTPLTTGSALRKSLTTEREAAGSFTMILCFSFHESRSAPNAARRRSGRRDRDRGYFMETSHGIVGVNGSGAFCHPRLRAGEGIRSGRPSAARRIDGVQWTRRQAALLLPVEGNRKKKEAAIRRAG